MDEKEILETISKKLDMVADDVRTNSYRLDKFEDKLEKFEGKFDSLEGKFDNLEGRFDKLETTSSARFDRLDNSIEAIADNVRLLSKQFTAVTGKVMENDGRLGQLESRVAVLEGETH